MWLLSKYWECGNLRKSQKSGSLLGYYAQSQKSEDSTAYHEPGLLLIWSWETHKLALC